MKRLTKYTIPETGFSVVSEEKYKRVIREEKPSVEKVYNRLKKIEDILGDEYDLERLRELAQADREGRCVVLPCKVGDTLYRIQRFKRGKNWRKEAEYIRTVELNKNNFWRVVFEGELGETVFLTREAADAVLKGDQHG